MLSCCAGRGQRMKNKKIWIFVLVVCIMTLTTVFYVTMVRNAKTSYANGRFVELEGEAGYGFEYYLLEAGTR